jgi:hypothetical protein
LRGEAVKREKTAGHGAKSEDQNDTPNAAERIASEYKVALPQSSVMVDMPLRTIRWH